MRRLRAAGQDREGRWRRCWQIGVLPSDGYEARFLAGVNDITRRFRQSASPNHLALPTNPLRP